MGIDLVAPWLEKEKPAASGARDRFHPKAQGAGFAYLTEQSTGD
jgi:hypothetical protein